MHNTYSFLLTTDDAAAVLGVTKLTVGAWRENSGLPAIVFLGRSRDAIRICPDALRAWATEAGKTFKDSVLDTILAERRQRATEESKKE